MRITRLGSHILMLTRLPRLFPMNCFIVVEVDGLTLVDSTMLSVADDVARLADELGAPVRRLALTHAHGDHVGGVAGVRRRFPGIEVSLGERDVPILLGDRSPREGEPESPLRGSFIKVDWKPDVALQPGQLVGSLEVVPTPGHTPGHVAFLDRRDRALLAGDAFQTRGGLAVSGVLRPLFPFPALATWDRAAAAASAAALVDLQPSLLAVGHGPALTGPVPAMEHAVEEARRRLD